MRGRKKMTGKRRMIMMSVRVLTLWNLAACMRSSFAAVSGLSLVLTTDSSIAVAMSAELMPPRTEEPLCSGGGAMQKSATREQWSS